jgi:hypothetical protein
MLEHREERGQFQQKVWAFCIAVGGIGYAIAGFRKMRAN